MCCAASVIRAGITWLYVFMVRTIVLCPEISMTTLGEVPCASSSEAHPRRKSWNRILASPLALRVAWN
jgi:hypothetical protein